MIGGPLQRILSVPVTGGAFSLARYKIKSIFFSDLCTKLLACYLQMPGKRRWKELLVIALDGSMGSLPSSKEIEDHFGVYSVNKFGVKRYMSRLFMAYDVLNDYVLSSHLVKSVRGEVGLLMDCIDQLKGRLRKYVYVMDRNFDSFSTIKQVLQSDPFARICVRLGSGSGFYEKALAHPEDDFILPWYPSRKEKETCHTKGIATDPLRVRVTKVVLSSGELEVLVSTLFNQAKYTKENIYTLYGLRWGVEEGFKNLKPKMKLEQYGCKKVEGVYQEFYAHIFMMNLVALHGMIAQEEIAEQTDQTKYRCTYNWKTGYRLVRGKLVELFHRTGNSILDTIEWLISHFTRSKIPIKPGRSFPRDLRWNPIKTRITPYNK